MPHRKEATHKILFIILVVLSFSILSCGGGSNFSPDPPTYKSLAWSPPALSSSGVAIKGYKIYYGVLSQNYIYSLDVGNTASYDIFTLPNLPINAVCYFAVTAYFLDGSESDYSNEVSQKM